MGKRIHSQPIASGKLTEYEIEQQKRLRYNEIRMKAAGFDTLTSKHILVPPLSQHEITAKKILEDHDLSDDEYVAVAEEYETEEEQMNLQKASCQVTKSKKGETVCGAKTPKMRVQPRTMAAFVNVRSSEKGQAVVQTEKKQRKVASLPENNKLQKKAQTVAPGSMAMYLKMRRKQRNQNVDVGQSQVQEHEVESEEEVDDLHANNQEVHNMEEQITLEIEAQNDVEVNPFSNAIRGVKDKKTRGPTVMAEVHNRKFDERPILVLNGDGQPIGPIPEVVREFSRFLGTLAKDSKLAPLNFCEWADMPFELKDKMWDYVLEKYMVPMEGHEWVMTTINTLWRVWKSRVKAQHYKAYESETERWEHRPTTVPESQFKDLLHYWDIQEIQEKSEMNKLNRLTYDDPHTMGPTSFALLRHKLQQKDPNKQPPSQAQLYKESRQRTLGKKYLTKPDKSMENVEKMVIIQAQQACGESSNTQDPYDQVMDKDEHNGYLRLYGRGITKSKIKKRGKNTNYILPQEFLESIKADLAPTIREDLTREVAQDITSLILSQIKAANPEINLVIPHFQGNNTHANEETGPNEE